MGRGRTAPGQLTVLHSLRPPRPGVTGYVDQVVEGAPPQVHPRFFSWRAALTGRYDVLHVHWPELLVRDRRRLRRFAKRRALDVLLARLALGRVPLVWTVHNLTPHESWSAAERRAVRRLTAAADLAIRLNPTTDLDGVTAPGVPAVTIPHGHYRDRFAGLAVPDPVPGRLLYAGIIRPYKGVAALLDAFAALPAPGLSLHVVGDPHPGQREVVEAAAARDPRVATTLRYVDDAELVAEVGQAELVVLPYTAPVHNSGAVLVALSLDRPVLVPASPSTTALAAEVGPGWVHTYDGPLTPAVLSGALDAVRRTPPRGRPQLAGRDWAEVGRRHHEAYRQARSLRRSGRRAGR